MLSTEHKHDQAILVVSRMKCINDEQINVEKACIAHLYIPYARVAITTVY